MTGPAGSSVAIRLAPAKLNLTLAVVGRRPDGYHELHSVMVPLSLADRLSLSPGAGPTDSLAVRDPAGRPVDLGPVEDNLVLRAIREARSAIRRAGWDAPLPPLAARLEKHLPVAAGLAGGSSDAAAAIDAALEAWGLAGSLTAAPHDGGGREGNTPGSPLRELAGPLVDLASRIGSDVPFFLARGWALVEGRGERVTPLPAPRGGPLAVLIVTPTAAVATPRVFAAFTAGARPAVAGTSLAASTHLAAELRRGLRADALLARAGVIATANDLIAAARATLPALTEFQRGLARVLRAPVGQSGSGPTAWVLYASSGEAQDAAREVRAAIADGRLIAPGDRPPFVAVADLHGERSPGEREDSA